MLDVSTLHHSNLPFPLTPPFIRSLPNPSTTSLDLPLRRCQTRWFPLTVSGCSKKPLTVSVNGNTCHTWIVSVNGHGYKQRKHEVSDDNDGQLHIDRKWRKNARCGRNSG